MTNKNDFIHYEVGITFGAFDMLHAGHLALLTQAKKRCDRLIVGLHIDPSIERTEKSRPVETVFERAMRLHYLPMVDEVIVYETEQDLKQMLLILQPEVRFLGDDYKDEDYTGKDMTYDLYLPRTHNFSSTSIRKRLK